MTRRLLQAGLGALLVALSALVPAIAQPKAQKQELVSDSNSGHSIVKGQLLVTLKPGVKEESLKAIMERFEAKYEVVHRLPSMNQFTLQTDHARLHELRQRLANHPYVAAASFNTMHTSHQMPVVKKPAVNDPVFDKPADKLIDKDNWNLYRIKVPEAWEITRGGALVAVVDSGSKTDHEELRDKKAELQTFAPNAEAGSGVKTLLTSKGEKYQEEVRDHGTHVAITATGTANTGVGTAAIAPASPLLPIQSLYYWPGEQNDGTGKISGQTRELIAGVERAVNAGAAVVNCSFGTYLKQEVIDRWRAAKTDDERAAVEREILPSVQEEIRAYAPVLDLANRRGTIIVVAAGNQDMPAHLYALALSMRAITVGAIDSKDKRYDHSNFGPYTTVCAPGVDVFSGLARENNDLGFYGYMTGTSMAAPHVTGVVALMKTIDPGLKHADVVDILLTTSEAITTDKYVGPLVNAKAALEETKRRLAQGTPRQPEPPPLSPQPPPTPVTPELPPNPITWIEQPDPWTNVYIQQIIQVWLSIAIATPPEGAAPGGMWVYNQFGQIINVNVSINIQQPVWIGFQYRWLWENSLMLQSTNMGSLYEFLVGTLRIGRFNPAPPRVPEEFRPRATDPKPRQGGLPFDPTLRNTRWKGTNARQEVIEISFTQETVEIIRAKVTTSYRFRINTYFTPMTIDLIPVDGKGETIAGLIQVTGLGEILFRTDFTAKRPLKIARGDGFTFVLKRTDIEVKEPGATADGVQLPILYRGTETLIRGLEYPKKADEKTIWGATNAFKVHNYALSGDGKRVWLGLFNPNEKDLQKRVQIWSMNLDGGDAKQASFTMPDESVPRFDYLLTNHDGSIAWIYIRLNYAGGWGGHAVIQTVTPGGTAKLVAHTSKIKGITNCVEPRLTKDGKSLFTITDLGVTRFDQDGHHHVVADRKHITLGKAALNDYCLGLSQLVISEDGAHWAMAASFQGAQTPKAPQAVIVGSAKGMQQIVLDNKDGTYDNCVRLTMTQDGKTVLYQRENQYKRTYPVYLLRDGVSQLVRADRGTVSNALLSAEGNRFFATVRTTGGSYPDVAFLEDMGSGRRHRTVTTAVPTLSDTWWTGNDIRLFQTSQNGDTYIAKPEGDLGLYVFRSGAQPKPEQPTIQSVRQRYDGDKLKITIEVKATEKLGRVFLLPLKNGYLPAYQAVPGDKNGLAGMGFGAKAYPVEKRPGVYEVVVGVGQQHAFLDDSYSFRVVVANADQTQATFQDYPVLK